MFTRSLVWVVLVAGLATGLSAEEFRFSGDIGLRPIGEPVRESIVWESNAADALVKACEAHVPLIVVFTNAAPPGEVTKNIQQLMDMQADGLAEFAGKAVFVNVSLHEAAADNTDPYGVQLVQLLQVETVPTISFIAPNLTAPQEVYRLEGYFSIAEIKACLAQGIASAMIPEVTWCPPTLKHLVEQMNSAVQEGNTLKYATCFAEPSRSRLVNLARTRQSVAQAKRRLLDALDAKFGSQVERLAFMDDDDEVRTELQQFAAISLVESVRQSERIQVKLRFSKRTASGDVTDLEIVMTAVFEQHGWRLQAPDMESSADEVQHWGESLKDLPALFDRLAENVHLGVYADAQTVLDLAKSAYHLRKSSSMTAATSSAGN